MIMPGGKPTMFMSILMFGEPGAEIMYPDPGFPIYRSMIEYTGATPVPIPIREENGFAFSAEETLGLITPKTRLIIINSPANPTGGVTPKAEVDKFVAGLEKWPDVAVMSDEIYDQLIYDGQEHVTLLNYPSIRNRLILLNGWSKTYAMTGWRLGYAVWPGKLYENARKLAVNLHSCVNAPTQYAGLAALTGPQDAVAHMRAEFDKRRKVVVEGLNKLPGVSCIRPAGAFYAFPNVQQTGWKAKPLANALLDETGVALIGGPDFGILGRGLSAARLTPTPLRIFSRRWAAWASSWRRGKQPKLFKAVIFDCDGVLVDSEVLALEVELAILREQGLEFDRHDYVTRFMGLSYQAFHLAMDEEAQKRIGRTISDEIRDELATRLRQTMIARLTGSARRDPGGGVGHASQGGRQFQHQRGLERKLRQVGLWGHFAPHVYSAEHVVHAKPAPDLFLHAAAALKIAPADCLVIEDSVHGVVAARAAGMRVWGFLGGGHAHDGLRARLTEAGAERIAQDWAEVARILPDVLNG